MAAPESADAVVAVAVSGRRSRRALRWAAENLIRGASRVVLVHVIPPICPVLSTSSASSPPTTPLFSSLTSYLSLNNSSDNSGSSSARESGGVEEELSGEIVELRSRYVAAERREREKEAFEPYKSLCGTDEQVEIEVLDGEDVAGAILDFAVRFQVKNLVLGCASFVWLNRMVKGHDVPETVLNKAPATCNVFLVSRRKVVLKPSESSGFRATLHIQKIKSSLFTQGERDCQTPRSRSLPIALTQNYQPPTNHRRTDSLISNDSDLFNSSHQNHELALVMPSIWEEQHDHHQANDNCPEVRRSQTHPLVFTQNDSAATPSEREIQNDAEEVERLRSEIEKTCFIYHRACRELAFERRKVKLMSAECSETEMKLRQTQEIEQISWKIAEDKKIKLIEAEKKIEEAKQLLVKEALERHNAEINASKVYREKLKTMNALFSSENICRSYSSYEIAIATNNFSQAMKIGEGGYGDVYKCYLDQIPVAIKVLRKDTIEKMEQFLREVEVLTQLRHPHIVLLLGVCAESGCLIYEYMENESLEDRLFCKNDSKSLPWDTRFHILYEVACTLAFLHGLKPDPIIHCDLKPGNILLDRNYVSKIGDVGLAKLASNVVPDDITEYGDSQIIGTPYYVDPEYQRTGTLRPKSDLYAFGIIALQMLTKRTPVGLIFDVENALKDGTFATILDDSVTGWPLEESEKLAWLALECAALRCRERPDLGSEVIPQLKQILGSLGTRPKKKEADTHAPSLYYCPILREVMDDPCIAMDGFTYERCAIEAWFAKHSVSPMTGLTLTNTCIVPNLTMHSAIQEWRSGLELLPSRQLNA